MKIARNDAVYIFCHGVSVFCVVVFLFLFVFLWFLFFFVVLFLLRLCLFWFLCFCGGVFFGGGVFVFSPCFLPVFFLFVEKRRGKRCWPPTFDHGELISFISHDPDCYLDWWKGEILQN